MEMIKMKEKIILEKGEIMKVIEYIRNCGNFDFEKIVNNFKGEIEREKLDLILGILKESKIILDV
jgi:hypothetical protein